MSLITLLSTVLEVCSEVVTCYLPLQIHLFLELCNV